MASEAEQTSLEEEIRLKAQEIEVLQARRRALAEVNKAEGNKEVASTPVQPTSVFSDS